jgi:glycerophosphoryl diester phosphodiesterase
VDRIKAIDTNVPTGFLTFIDPVGPESVELAANRGHDAVHPHQGTVDAALVAFAHGLGLDVNVWTVDDPDRIRALAGFGVDGIVTNVPAEARAALRATRG